MIRRFLVFLFVVFTVLSFLQCARRGNPSGGDKDITPPKLIKAVPENMTTNFNVKKIRLYFDEYIKLKNIQDQLIISPPLKYTPIITPQGAANKYVEIIIKDTLIENTTYTLNFGQSIEDNNEGNPNSFLTYVFSTGDYIDSLTVSGAVKDAFLKDADTFISVLLYKIDSTYTDSTIFKRPPNHITNTLDSSVVFHLKNLKEGKYAMFAIKDAAKNNMFDQKSDKIAFIKDTVVLPTDSTFLLTLFKEIPDYSVSVPSYTSKNRILFGYQGEHENIEIKSLSVLPDTVRTIITKELEKDTLNFWFTPFETDSIVFTVTNEKERIIDTFNVKTRKVATDSLILTPNQSGSLKFEELFYITGNTPLVQIDSSKINLINKDSLAISFSSHLDTLKNAVFINFNIEPNEKYNITLFPGAITDFFETENDTISYNLSTKSLADFGNLQITLKGAVVYPLLIQLTDESNKIIREIYATEPKEFEFNSLQPGKYLVRVIYDENHNEKWDTGNYLKKIQPERVSYYPGLIEMRANWEKKETFTLLK
ncbi:MAG: Ig-like domain-containing protein [Cellulophaga sp.]